MQSENRQITGGVGNHKRTNCYFFLVKSEWIRGWKGFPKFPAPGWKSQTKATLNYFRQLEIVPS